MSALRTAAEGVTVLGILGGLFFNGYQTNKLRDLASIQRIHAESGRQGTAPGNSPVKIVGGSMTFRSTAAWTAGSGGTWTTTIGNASTQIIELERVSFMNIPGELDDVILSDLTGTVTIEVDGRDPTGQQISAGGTNNAPNGALLSLNLTGGTVTVAPTSGAAANVGFWGPNAPTWSKSLYSGLRYKDQSKGTGGANDCTIAGTLCESIYQIVITPASGTKTTFLCPDGECRVDIGTPQ